MLKKFLCVGSIVGLVMLYSLNASALEAKGGGSFQGGAAEIPDGSTVTEKPKRTKVYTDEATVKKVQEQLNDLGYDCGVADGINNEKTQKAITDYQRDYDLIVSGSVNEDVLQSLDNNKAQTDKSTKEVDEEEKIKLLDNLLFRQYVECDDLDLEYYFEFEYDQNGRKIARKEYSQKGSMKNKIEYHYDEQGEIQQEIEYSLTGSVNSTIDYEYDSYGNLKKKLITRTGGKIAERLYQYDSAGKLIEEIYRDEDGAETTWIYLYEGDKIVQVDIESDGERETDNYYKYDVDGRLISTVGPDGSGDKYEYDENGLKIKETYIIQDSPYLISTFEYRKLNEFEEEIDNQEIVRLVQETLNSKGFSCGTTDGVVGDMTKSSIIAYMESIGEKSTGKITDDLVDKLDIEDEVFEIKELLKFRTDLNYEQLMRKPLDYIGKKVKLSGEVLQVINDNGKNELRIAMNSDSNQCILCSYSMLDMKGNSILEGDNLVVYGVSTGTEDYISVAGVQITVPSIRIERIESDYGVFEVFPGF